MENHSKVQELKTLSSNKQFNMNSEFQKNCNFQNFSTFGSYQHVSSGTSQKIALNESYTISNNFDDRKKLHVILEETFELSNSLDSNKFSYSCNTSGLNLNITYPEIKSSVSNQVNDISCPNLEAIDQSDLVESDDSLGILPLDLLEDMTLDNLIPDKPRACLNSTIDNMDKGPFISCFSDKGASILPSTALTSDSSFSEVASPICYKPNASFLCDQSQESPIQHDETFPKFASTPKHETDLFDFSDEVVNTLNNISSEFHLDTHDLGNERLAELHLKHGTHIKVDLHSIKPLECVQEAERGEEIFQNVALTYPNEHDQSFNEFCLENRHRVSEKSSEKVEILNTTYEKLDISPDLNKSIKTLHCSNQSVIAVKENIKTTRFTSKINKDKNVCVAALNLSFTKEESKSTFDRKNKFRKSVGCFGASNIKVDKKQVRRNSLTNSFNTSNDDFTKTKTVKLSRSKTLSFKWPAKTNSKILNGNSDLNKSNTILKQSSLNSEFSNNKIGEVKSFTEVKLQQNRENLLNETICLESAGNQSCVMNSLDDYKNLVGFNLTVNLNEKIPKHSILKVNLQNQKIEENLTPKVKFPDSREHFLDETMNWIPPSSEIGKTIVKKPRNSINFSLLRKNNLEPNKKDEDNSILTAKLLDSQKIFLNETISLTSPCSEIGNTIVKKPRNSIHLSVLRKNNLEPNKNAEENLIPKVKLPDSQENFLKETISLTPPSSEIRKTIVKKPRNSINFPLLRKNNLEPNVVEEHLIPKVKFPDSQENFLNETISLTPPSSEIGKTIVKKPRNSINVPLLRKSNLEPNIAEEHLIPKVKLPASQENFLNETISLTPPSSEIGKTIVKKPRNSINFSLLRKNNLEPNKVEENLISKAKLPDIQKKFLNETISLTPPSSEIGKTIVKKPRNSINVPLLRKSNLEPNIAEEHLIPKAKLPASQENFLNETISLTPPSSEIGKTIVKKPRNSINFSLLRKNNLEPNKVEENLISKAKLPDIQENFLNETISLTPPSSEIGKTIVKKPRNSMNFSLSRKNNLENCENLQGINKTVYENDTIPSKQKGRRSFSIAQNKKSQINNTNIFNRTLKKPSVADAVAVNEKNNIARSNHFSEKSMHAPLSEVNHNRPGRQSSAIPARKPICVTKKRTNDILMSRKSVNETSKQSKVNLNDTIILPGSETDFNKDFAAPKHTNQEASKLPVSKIPSVQVRKMTQVKTGDGSLPSTSQIFFEQEKSSHRMIPRNISSTRKIKSPRFNCI